MVKWNFSELLQRPVSGCTKWCIKEVGKAFEMAMRIPEKYRKRPTHNEQPKEHLNEEIRRCERVIRILPNRFLTEGIYKQ